MQSLKSRYDIFDFLVKKINNVTHKINCLDKSSDNIFELFYYYYYYGKYQYKLTNLNIFLIKVIGEQSLMGTIYLSKFKNYKFITKIILLNYFSIKELEITEKLSNIAYKNKNIHLPLLYGHSLCNKINIELKLLDDDKKIFNPENSYYCLFIELYEGSMYLLLIKLFELHKTDYFKYYIYNIIMQCFISILSCHINNIYHNDSHINNFLYCYSQLSYNYKYKYLYNDLEFIVNCQPFIISICDFGLSNYKNDNNNDDNDNDKFKKDYKILLDSINKYYITKYKLQDIINLDLIYNLLEQSNNDYELFNNLKKNKFFNDDDNENENYNEIIINLV